jgi:long-subunit acyl-CoA synthetase (AMP-forming)
MKPAYYPLGLLALATFSTVISSHVTPASAQCVMNDTNIQVAINGSKQATDRSNRVSKNSTGSCVGNAVNSTNVQSTTGGTDRASQQRQSTQQVNGGTSSLTGVSVPPVNLQQNVQIDVYNPADRLRR